MIGIIQTSSIIRRARTLEQLKGSIKTFANLTSSESAQLRCLNWLQGTKSKRNQGSRRHLLFFWKPQKRIMSSAVKMTYSCIQDASPFKGTQGWCEDMLSIPLKLKASDTEEVFDYLESGSESWSECTGFQSLVLRVTRAWKNAENTLHIRKSVGIRWIPSSLVVWDAASIPSQIV